MGKIRVVEFRPPEPKHEIIELLEGLLSEARQGRIQRIIAAVAEPSGDVHSLWRFGGNFVETAGMSAILHNAIMNDAILKELEEVTGKDYSG